MQLFVIPEPLWMTIWGDWIVESNRLVFFDTRLGVEDQDFFESENQKIRPKTKIA